MTSREDLDTLTHEVMRFAALMLREHGEFFPFGQVMRPDGELVSVGVDLGTEQPASQDVLDALVASFREDAAAGNLRASARGYDMLVVPPGGTDKVDAVAIALDHEDGTSIVVCFPYASAGTEAFVVEAPFAGPGRNLIFAAS